MRAKTTYGVLKSSKTAGSKSCRIVKNAGSMPLTGALVVKGTRPDHTTKIFRFSILSVSQQLKERNAAYHFFHP